MIFACNFFVFSLSGFGIMVMVVSQNEFGNVPSSAIFYFLIYFILFFKTFIYFTLFYFKNFIYFNWRLITLQYCSGFCYTLLWMSHGCTCVLHPEPASDLPLHPIPQGSSQYTSPEHPFSCIKPWLAICFTYDNIHVSMLFSQIIPPLPSPTESKSLFFASVSLLLSRI